MNGGGLVMPVPVPVSVPVMEQQGFPEEARGGGRGGVVVPVMQLEGLSAGGGRGGGDGGRGGIGDMLIICMPVLGCHHLPPPATTCHHLPPPATTCHYLPPPSTTCHCLPPKPNQTNPGATSAHSSSRHINPPSLSLTPPSLHTFPHRSSRPSFRWQQQ